MDSELNTSQMSHDEPPAPGTVPGSREECPFSYCFPSFSFRLLSSPMRFPPITFRKESNSSAAKQDQATLPSGPCDRGPPGEGKLASPNMGQTRSTCRPHLWSLTDSLARDPNATPWPPTLHKHVQSRCTRLNTKESHIIKNSSLDLPLISTQPTLFRSPWSQDQLCSHTAWYKTKMQALPFKNY